MSGFTGIADAAARSGDFNQHAFLISQMLSKVETCALVQVVTVTTTGGINPAGTVDVLPLVNQIDGDGNAMPHGTVHALPFFRLQAGANAIIIDPVVGDIGMAGFASRDISSVKANKAQANPGSRRRHDFADGLYFGGFLNGQATQYLAFLASGISIVSPTAVTLHAPMVSIASPTVAITGNVFTHNGVNVGSTHRHGGVQAGTANTSFPL